MAHLSVVAAVLLGVSYVIFRVLNTIVEARRRTRRARELGCKEPPHEPTHLPFGLDMVRAALRAEKAKLFPEWIKERTEAMGVNTCKSTWGEGGRLIYLLLAVAGLGDDDFLFTPMDLTSY